MCPVPDDSFLHYFQDCEDFQPYRKFIAEELAVHLIIDIKTVKAAELNTILGFNQLDPIMAKQEPIGLKIRKTFSNEEVIEDFYTKKFDYMIDFYLPKREFAIDVDEVDHEDRKQNKENNLHLLELILMKKILVLMMGLVRIQAFIDKLKDEELEKLKDKLKN